MTPQTNSNAALSAKGEINGSDDETTEEATEDELSTDDVFHLLQNERRRRVIAYLEDHDDGEGIDMREVTEWIAAREHDTTVQALRSKERQRVYIALYQSHLPKLADAGVIDYDKRKGWVTSTERTARFAQYVGDETAEESAEPADSRNIQIDSAATGVGALLLVAGYPGFVPIISNYLVSLGLFALILFMAVSRVVDRVRPA